MTMRVARPTDDQSSVRRTGPGEKLLHQLKAFWIQEWRHDRERVDDLVRHGLERIFRGDQRSVRHAGLR
jgi:hypothetical protein